MNAVAESWLRNLGSRQVQQRQPCMSVSDQALQARQWLSLSGVWWVSYTRCLPLATKIVSNQIKGFVLEPDPYQPNHPSLERPHIPCQGAARWLQCVILASTTIPLFVTTCQRAARWLQCVICPSIRICSPPLRMRCQPCRWCGGHLN